MKCESHIPTAQPGSAIRHWPLAIGHLPSAVFGCDLAALVSIKAGHRARSVRDVPRPCPDEAAWPWPIGLLGIRHERVHLRHRRVERQAARGWQIQGAVFGRACADRHHLGLKHGPVWPLPRVQRQQTLRHRGLGLAERRDAAPGRQRGSSLALGRGPPVRTARGLSLGRAEHPRPGNQRAGKDETCEVRVLPGLLFLRWLHEFVRLCALKQLAMLRSGGQELRRLAGISPRRPGGFDHSGWALEVPA